MLKYQDMEKAYKAIRELSPVELKVRLSAVAKYHREIDKAYNEMRDDIDNLEDKFEVLCAPLYQAQEEIILGKRLLNEEELELKKEFFGDEDVEDHQEPLEDFWL